MAATRTILVVGATGKQGSAFIAAATAKDDIRILALTRNTSSPAAKALTSDKVTLVQANLDKPDSVRKVFQDEQGKTGIWGVFVVLAFPGLGEDATGEEKQGMLLADLALEYKVHHFVFSSLERGGESFDDNYTLDRAAKVKIERHIRSLDGLSWTILRPAFFMENFDGAVGTITSTVLRCGLKPDTKLMLLSGEDMGPVAHAVFEAPDEHAGKCISIIGDSLTSKEWNDAYKRGSGKALPGVPAFVAKPLLAMNSHTKALVADIERVHKERSSIEENFDALLKQSRALYPGIQTFEEWARRKGKKAARKERWNNVTVGDLVQGKR
ncbi:NAD(P)-binding protein [Rickenella mellea]|uniref:NAD(P)-binding protein n=1 Tax=Rickenella mellea TaxID=50990 RepID=A0A4Y7PTL5_9AGAM|nr:NAD(P)-binding protein [Rickenella mellea]